MGVFKDTQQFLNGLEGLCISEGAKDLVVKIMNQAGVLGLEEWSNVPLHCLRAAQVAEAIGRSIDLAEEQLGQAVLAALFHDVMKPWERKRANELIASEGLAKDAAFTQAAKEESKWLLEHGVAEHIIETTGLTGHTSLAHFKAGKGTLAQRIVFLVDNLCGGDRGDEVVMWSDRVSLLKQRYPWLATEGTEILGGETYMQAQDRLTRQILEEMAELAGVENGVMFNRELVRQFQPA